MKIHPNSLKNLSLRTKINKGEHLSIATEFKKGQVSPLKGKKNPKGIIAKMGKNNPMYGKKYLKKPESIKKGANHYNWKGGITPEIMRIRHSVEYKLWRTAVFTRDNFTCIWCGDNKGGNLEADHIKRFSDYPELRFAIDNGRTLCKKCHKTTDTWGNKKQNI